LAARAPLNWAVTGDVMWSAFGTGAAGSAWFDLAFVMLGTAMVFATAKLPAERPADTRRRKKEAAEAQPAGELQPAE
ncbi:MAG: hypothetical protein AAFQ13_13735, partial [Pseudomonadota bacterium]